MADGRFLHRKISRDKKVDSLSCDTSRLAFTWAIAHLDVEGRIEGDPALLCHTLFPRRTDITADEMAAYIAEWAEAGLVVWYEVGDDTVLYFPGFAKNQRGLRKDREAASYLPPPPPEDQCRKPTAEQVRSSSGVTPEQVRSRSADTAELLPPKLSKVKISQEKGLAADAAPNGTTPLRTNPVHRQLDISRREAGDASRAEWGREAKAAKTIVERIHARLPDLDDAATIATVDQLYDAARRRKQRATGDYWATMALRPTEIVRRFDQVFGLIADRPRIEDIPPEEDLFG